MAPQTYTPTVRTPAQSPEPAEWLAERLLGPWSGPEQGNLVGAIVPTGFEAYARVFPSLELSAEKRLRWAELAAVNGRVAHSLMEFHLIASPTPGHGPSPFDPDRDGPLGPMLGTEIREFAEILRDFTRTPGLCWYCVWVGYGGIAEAETGARIHHSMRDYFLSSGPIGEVTSFDGEGPDIWWPDDRAWCVGSDTDLAATYVGGSSGCIDALLGSEALEALPVSSDDRVDVHADVINSRGE